MMFKALRTPRRIILSGTPIQNDLSEFHAMVSFFRQGTCLHKLRCDLLADFCNPGLLGNYCTLPALRVDEP